MDNRGIGNLNLWFPRYRLMRRTGKLAGKNAEFSFQHDSQVMDQIKKDLTVSPAEMREWMEENRKEI